MVGNKISIMKPMVDLVAVAVEVKHQPHIREGPEIHRQLPLVKVIMVVPAVQLVQVVILQVVVVVVLGLLEARPRVIQQVPVALDLLV